MRSGAPISSGERVGRAARVVVVVLAVLAALLPLVYVVRVGLMSDEDFLIHKDGLGGGATFDNVSRAWTHGGLGSAFLNSLAVVPLGAAISTVLATAAGFAFAKLPVPGRRALFVVVAMALTVPLPAIVLPLFAQMNDFGLSNSRLGLSLLYGGIFSVWCTLFMRSYFEDFPASLLEAARMDGCSYLQLFGRVVVPLALPAIATTFVINLFIQWGELLLALVMLPTQAQQTVSVTVGSFASTFVGASPLTAAAAVIAAVPVLLVFLVSQRFLQSGARAGAVKG